MFVFACGGEGSIQVNPPHADPDVDPSQIDDLPVDEPQVDDPSTADPQVDDPTVDQPVVDESPPPPPQIDEEVEVSRKFEFNVPDNTRLIHDGFADAKCETCAPEYVFTFDGLADIPSNGTVVEDVLYDMTVIVDPVDVGRFPHVFVQAVELEDGSIQAADNINDEWTGTWITNAARVDASTGHTFLFIVNLNLQTEEAAQYLFRELLAGFRINK